MPLQAHRQTMDLRKANPRKPSWVLSSLPLARVPSRISALPVASSQIGLGQHHLVSAFGARGIDALAGGAAVRERLERRQHRARVGSAARRRDPACDAAHQDAVLGVDAGAPRGCYRARRSRRPAARSNRRRARARGSRRPCGRGRRGRRRASAIACAIASGSRGGTRTAVHALGHYVGNRADAGRRSAPRRPPWPRAARTAALRW